MSRDTSESGSRQDQILAMAAEGLTDKEIAARLGLSPETVGTYWRRILAKFAAASRTEVVAKAVRLQGEANLAELSDVVESLREVTDHLLLTLSASDAGSPTARAAACEALLDSLPDVVAEVDIEGFVTLTNAAVHGLALDAGEPLEWAIDPDFRDSLREALATALESGTMTQVQLELAGVPYDCKIGPAGTEAARTAVASMRRVRTG